jgi:pimeloyl-ACP methyl ester carboxylesterase
MSVERMLNFQDKKIFYRLTGEGPTVVLLHGVPLDGNVWQSQVNALSGFRIIVPDLPGSGVSEIIDDMSIPGMSEVIKAILDEEELFVASLIGHSMGGYVSLAFAERYPEHLTGLGLFHSTAYPDNEERKQARKNAIEFVEKNGAFEFLKASIPRLFSDHEKQKNAVIIEELIRNANNFSSRSLVYYYNAMLKRPDRTSVLKNLKIPMLFVAGKYDSAVPLNDILEQCHLPEKSYFHVLGRSGHMGMVEEPDKTNIILNRYLLNLS